MFGWTDLDRTQRFGLALNFDGHLNLRLQKYARDFDVIDKTCHCATCDFGNGVSRSYLHHLAGRETVGAHAVTVHNIAYQVGDRVEHDVQALTSVRLQHRLMKGAREAILEDRFPAYLKTFFKCFYKQALEYPCVRCAFRLPLPLTWILQSLGCRRLAKCRGGSSGGTAGHNPQW